MKLLLALAIIITTLQVVPSPAGANPNIVSSKVTGTYVRGEAPLQSRLRVSQLSNGNIRFYVLAYKCYPTFEPDEGAISGEVEGTVPLVGSTAEWKNPKGTGKLNFTFTPTSCTINQVGSDVDCGFGHGANASGTYKKISSVTSSVPSLAASTCTTADGLVRELYAEHKAHYIFEYQDDKVESAHLSKYFAPELIKLIQVGRNNGNFDFDPLFQGNADPDIHDFKIGKAVTAGSTTTVPVSFRNYQNQNNLTFVLRKLGQGWRIIDIKSSKWDFVKQLRS